MELNIFGFRVVLDRANCPFCMFVDAFAIVSLVLAALIPQMIPVDAVAFAFAYFGITDELYYQASAVNFFPSNELYMFRGVQIPIAVFISLIYFFAGGFLPMILFLISSSAMLAIDLFKYKNIYSLKGDFVLFAAFLLLVLLAYSL
ncbi:MAG: hypothetical protein ACP5M9_04355 [Candidatus Micrarchaeia archaeon]